MTKNPFVNALSASLYIVLLVSVIFYGPKIVGDVEETIVIPIVMLSLFTLSAGTMGYLFLFTPVRLLLEGQKKEGITLFLQTLAVFAGITVLFAVAMVLVG